MKLSYSCFPKIKSKIASHNRKLLNKNLMVKEARCNCQKKNECPMQGEGPCDVGSVVYLALVTSQQLPHPKNYIGSSNNFKKRIYRHRQSFRDISLKTDCALAEFIWSCQEKGFMPNVKFEVIHKVTEYSPETKKCYLCVCEKLAILSKLKDPNNLNSTFRINEKM